MQDETIQVSGHMDFPKSEWRRALLCFLFGMWSSDASVTHRPKIDLSGGGIRFDPQANSYTCFQGDSQEEPWPVQGQKYDFERVVNVAFRDGAHVVETSLIRFVKNNALRRVVLRFTCGHSLILTKGRKRGDLQVLTQAP